MTSYRYKDDYSEDQMSQSEKQDAKFDRFIADMKPFVLRLPHKLERQRVGLWIKKLCEAPGPTPSSRKNRNLYAQLLIHMLKRGLLEDPFTRRPEAGPLQPLPSYMSIYLDEPIAVKSPSYANDEEFGGRDPPDWVRDLGSSIASSMMSDMSASIPPRLRRELPTTNGAHPMPSARSNTYSSSSRDRNSYEPAMPKYDNPTNGDDGYRTRPSLGRDRNSYEPAMPKYDNTTNGDDSYRPRQSLGYPPEDEVRSYEGERGYLSPGKRQGNSVPSEPYYPPREYRHPDSGYPSSSPPSKSNHYNNGYTSQYSRGVNMTLQDDPSLLIKTNDREVELKVKVVETKFHEEKLKLQQQHDVAVQKILDRKNMELEDIKSHYRNKVTEMEATIKKHERKISQANREANALKEQKDKQILELKKLAEENGDNVQHNYEKKLNDKIAEFEQEKFEMQKQHTNNIQELLDETNQRLQKMETEYNHQTAGTGLVIQELESRVHQLTQESEALQDSRTKLAKEKEELTDKLSYHTKELEDARATLTKFERDHSRMMNDHQMSIQQLQRKTDSTMELMKQEQSAHGARSSDTISELESQVTQLKQALQDSEYQRQKQLRDMESGSQQDKLSLEHLYDKKIRGMQAEMDQQDLEQQKRIRKLESTAKEKEEHIQRLTEMQKQQAHQAEHALEDFKNQVEKNSGRMFDEMKLQMEKVEEDLARSKNLREKQAKEFGRQMDDIKLRYDKQIAELKISQEQEKAQLIRGYQAERDSLLREQEQDKDMQAEKMHQKLTEIESHGRERSTKDAKTIAELEQQVRDLREELIQANSLRQTQLMELNMMREEDKQNYKRQEENQFAKHKSQLDQQRLQLQRDHSKEMEQLLERTNNKLKNMEQEYATRSATAQETIRTLEDEIKKLKEENLRTRLSAEKRLSGTSDKHSDEKSAMKKHHTSIVNSLEHDVDAQKSMVRHLEKRCKQMEIESQERVSRLRLQYEEKLKGLMPASLRDELEDTIESLRQQISVLHSRANILQDEIDTRNKMSTSSSFNLSTREDSEH